MGFDGMARIPRSPPADVNADSPGTAFSPDHASAKSPAANPLFHRRQRRDVLSKIDARIQKR
jgi:hypothetical protein